MTYSATVLADSPWGYWRLGESAGTTAADASGNGHTGTYAGGYTLGVPGLITGDTDTAVSFDGSSGYVDLGLQNFNGATAMTLEAWVKPTAFPTALAVNTMDILGGETGATNTTGMMIRAGQDGTAAMASTALAFFWTTPGPFNVPASAYLQRRWYVGRVAAHHLGTLAAGQRHHIVATCTLSVVNLYLDNRLIATTPVPGGTIINANIHLAIGVGIVNPGPILSRYWNGVIDEAALYLSALSPTRIAAHWNAGM